MTRITLLLIISFGACVPTPRVPVRVVSHTIVRAPTSAPVVVDAPLDVRVVAALVAAARALPTSLPEQVEVTVDGARYACYRWPLTELFAGRITPEVLWWVYVRELRDDGTPHFDFEVAP